MTPPKITGQSEGIYNQTAGVCEPAEPVSKPVEASGPVCSAERSYSPLRLLRIDLGKRYASLQRNHVLNLDAKSVLAAAAQGSRGVKAQGNDVPVTPFNFLYGCQGGPAIQPAPTDEPVLPVGENPPPMTGEHDGVGSVNGSFATGECVEPASLFGFADNKILLVCGDLEGPGANLVEGIDPQSGALSSISIPAVIEADDTRPVALSAGASHEGTQLIFAGLTPTGSEDDFQTNSHIYRNSGIYTVDAAGQNPQWTPFQNLSMLKVDGNAENIPLVSQVDGTNAGVRVSFDPNTPVSMTVDGDTLYVLNANYSNDQNGAFYQSLAPLSIHAFSIGPDGLTEKALGSQRIRANGVESPGHAIILSGNYGTQGAIASVGDGRLAVLIRGFVNPEDPASSENPSKILLINSEDGSFTASAIPLSDVAGTMVASNSNQLRIVLLNDEYHALVGAGDKSGRVALVNLDTGKVKYVGVFGEGHDVISIEVAEAGDQAIAVSSQGKVISINLKEIDGLTGLPTVGELHDIPADARLSALWGNSLVVAHPNKYSKVTVNPAPAAE